MELKEREVYTREFQAHLKKYYVEMFLTFLNGTFFFSKSDLDIFGYEETESQIDEKEMEEIVEEIYGFLKQFIETSINNFPFDYVKQNLAQILDGLDKKFEKKEKE